MKIIGHRGARGLAPENTIASLNKALQHNVDEIEFDVRVTKDNVAILHHDPELVDAAGNVMAISEYTYAELRHHKSDLTTFNEAAQLINRKVPMYVEVKPNVIIKPVAQAIQALLDEGWQKSDMSIGSYSQKTLVALHKIFPDIDKIVIERWSGIRAVWRAKQVATKRLAMNQRWLWWGFVYSMSKRGWLLHPYTLNNTDKANKWAKYGMYGVVTDFPDRFEK